MTLRLLSLLLEKRSCLQSGIYIVEIHLSTLQQIWDEILFKFVGVFDVERMFLCLPLSWHGVPSSFKVKWTVRRCIRVSKTLDFIRPYSLPRSRWRCEPVPSVSSNWRRWFKRQFSDLHWWNDDHSNLDASPISQSILEIIRVKKSSSHLDYFTPSENFRTRDSLSLLTIWPRLFFEWLAIISAFRIAEQQRKMTRPAELLQLWRKKVSQTRLITWKASNRFEETMA